MTAAETLAKIKTLFERDEAMEIEEADLGYYECSACGTNTTGAWLSLGMKFCPQCGQRLQWPEGCFNCEYWRWYTESDKACFNIASSCFDHKTFANEWCDAWVGECWQEGAESDKDRKASWCPFQPIPEKKDVRSASTIIMQAQEKDMDPAFYNGWLHGWNDCIDAITGGADEKEKN